MFVTFPNQMRDSEWMKKNEKKKKTEEKKKSVIRIGMISRNGGDF